MAKTAIFGGSFNPVHNGHVRLVKEVAAAVGLDKVIIMPTYISPFKKESDVFVADGKDRLEMCRLAFSDCPFAEVSDYELSLEQVSYTVNTLRHFKKIYDELYFIMGSDMLLSLEKWNSFEEVMQLCTVIAASRESDDFPLLEQKAEWLKKYGRVILVKISPYEMSSTLIREKIINNCDISCYMPENVVKYILDAQIYPKQ